MVYDDYDGLIYRKAPFSSWSCVRKSNNTLTSFQRRMYSKSSHNKYLKNFSSHIRHGCVCNCATIPQKDYEKYHWIGATWWQSRFSRVLSWESIGIEGKSCFRETRQSPLAMPDFLRIWPLETRKKYIYIYILYIHTYIYMYTYIYIYIYIYVFGSSQKEKDSTRESSGAEWKVALCSCRHGHSGSAVSTELAADREPMTTWAEVGSRVEEQSPKSEAPVNPK